MLSLRLIKLHRDAFVPDEIAPTTVDLAAHRGDSDLDDLDLGDTNSARHRRVVHNVPAVSRPSSMRRRGGVRFCA
jgi:hypothetical protein